MFSENLKNLRKSKGLSQEELAVRLSVVRQTVSKWENGLSVPDSELLIKIAEALDTSVSVLLGEKVAVDEQSELKAIAEKLEIINSQLAQRNEKNRKMKNGFFIALGIIAAGIILFILGDYFFDIQLMKDMDSSLAIIGGADGPTGIFVTTTDSRPIKLIASLLALIASAAGIYKTRKHN